jgi:hypothetical protein
VLAIILILNLGLALLCLLMAVILWRLQRTLAKVNRFIIRAEQRTQRVLAKAPRKILAGQARTGNLRLQLQQLARYQQILDLLNQSLKIWRWRRPSRRLIG